MRLFYTIGKLCQMYKLLNMDWFKNIKWVLYNAKGLMRILVKFLKLWMKLKWMNIISETRVEIDSKYSSLKTNSALYKSDVLRFASSERYFVTYLGQNLTWYFSRQQCSYNLSQWANKTKSDTYKIFSIAQSKQKIQHSEPCSMKQRSQGHSLPDNSML